MMDGTFLVIVGVILLVERREIVAWLRDLI